MGFDGSDRRVLLEAPTGYRVVHPAWAPDGSRIAYWIVPADQSCPGCHRELVVAEADGSNARRVASGAVEWGRYDAWSPDGRWIAFVDVNGAIAKIRPDGTGLETLLLPAHPAFAAAQPTWSPDGERIAFLQWNDLDFDLLVMNADGTDSHVVVSAADAGGTIGQPTWSPDGRLIAFVIGTGGGATSLWAYDAVPALDGDPKNRPFHLVGDGAGWNAAPVWIDGGARVGFLHRDDGRDLAAAASLQAVRIDDRTVETLVEDFPPTTGITVQPPPGGAAGACLERGPTQFIPCSEALQRAGLEDSGPQGSSMDVRLVSGVAGPDGAVAPDDDRMVWAVTFRDIDALAGSPPKPARIDWEMDIDARTGEFLSEGTARSAG
jgi:hypothetical protein